MEKKISFSIVLISCLFLSQSLLAQLSSQEVESIDQLFSKHDNSASPGCIVGVIKDGKLVYAQGFGMANLQEKISMGPETEFCIGSMTKQFTAACIGLLVQNGKVSLDEDIRTYLPELSNFDQRITVRHLLHHTSGIRDYSVLMNMSGKRYQRFTTYEETLPYLQKQSSLNFAPNTKHLYSNSGFLLLQEMVRRVSGQSLQSFADQHVFGPLGMDDTFYNADIDRITTTKTLSYRKDRGEFIPIVDQSGGVSNELIQTTLIDLLAWDQNFYHGKVGGTSLLTMLQTPGILEHGDTINYAHGLELGSYKGIEFVTHGGGNLGFGSDMIRFPEHRTSIIVLSNSTSINQRSLMYRIADIVLESHLSQTPQSAVEPVPTISLSNAQLKKYGGHYWNTLINQHRVVYFEDGVLRYNRPDRYESRLVPVAEHTFRMLNGRNQQTATVVRFVLKENDSKELYVRVGSGPESYSYSFEEVQPTPRYLRQFEGTFYNEDLDLTLDAIFMNKRLFLVTKQKMRFRLGPVKADYFAYLDGGVTFIRDSDRILSGFVADVQRARGLHFRKVE
ncbi:MAG: beta-lactamase family protein [Saprospiraceae bacterium]|nr:beta-lactamase family protein [Saprospiraceae bacterium]